MYPIWSVGCGAASLTLSLPVGLTANIQQCRSATGISATRWCILAYQSTHKIFTPKMFFVSMRIWVVKDLINIARTCFNAVYPAAGRMLAAAMLGSLNSGWFCSWVKFSGASNQHYRGLSAFSGRATLGCRVSSDIWYSSYTDSQRVSCFQEPENPRRPPRIITFSIHVHN